MSRQHPIVVERLRHVPGELLRSRDLSDGVTSELELLWWHQRAVHDAVGVVTGLVASTVGLSVHVSPGVAYDPRGRELTLAREATIDAPVGNVSPVLALCRCADCPPELTWVAPDRLRRCDCVVLARWDPHSKQRLQPAQVRARATARPRIASGATLPGATAWEPWLALQRLGLGSGLEVRVDTRAAGFAAAPCYFAWLQWPRAAASGQLPYRSFGLQHLAEETADGFTFRVLLQGPSIIGLRASTLTGGGTGGQGSSTTAYARTQRLSVAWLALEGDHDSGGGT